MSKKAPELSIVIPSYRKAEVIEETLNVIILEIRKSRIDFEVIVVIDGDVDQTSDVLSRIEHEELTYFTNQENHGKGNAIRYGISMAKGKKYCALLDADLDLSPVTVLACLDFLRKNTDVGLVLGSKFHRESINNYSNFRKLQSKLYSKLVTKLFDLGVSETQTGMKVGRMSIMKPAIENSVTDGFAFDLELLLRLKNAGCKFREVSVMLNHGDTTTVKLWNAFKVVFETFRIYRNFNKKWRSEK